MATKFTDRLHLDGRVLFDRVKVGGGFYRNGDGFFIKTSSKTGFKFQANYEVDFVAGELVCECDLEIIVTRKT